MISSGNNTSSPSDGLEFWEMLDLDAQLSVWLSELHGSQPVTSQRRNELVHLIKQGKRRLEVLRNSI